jgi:hypothetical protein
MRTQNLTINVVLILTALSLPARALQGPGAGFSSLPPAARDSIVRALRQDMAWKQLAELTASDGTDTEGFSASVAIDGNTVVVGAPDANIGNNQGQGTAYVFVKPRNGWENMTQVAKLTASDGKAGDEFGWSVAISGNTVLVGSFNAGGGGEAYIFVRPPRGWRSRHETARIGCCSFTVAIRRDVAVCGGGGVAKIYVKPQSGWKSTSSYDAFLVASDGDQTLGLSVATTGDTVVAGAPDTDGENQSRGAAYVFVRPKNGWGFPSNIRRIQTETAKLTASDSGPGYNVGLAVSISGETVVAGAPYAQDNSGNSGAAYVFVKPASGWANMAETAKLTANTTDSISTLGFSVALRGGTLVAGNPTGTVADNAEGEAYVFAKPAGGWATTSTFDARLAASDGQKYDYFGNAVSLSGTIIVVGNNRYFIKLPGAAYVFGH